MACAACLAKIFLEAKNSSDIRGAAAGWYGRLLARLAGSKAPVQGPAGCMGTVLSLLLTVLSSTRQYLQESGSCPHTGFIIFMTRVLCAAGGGCAQGGCDQRVRGAGSVL
jgi:hypothetical protein